MIPIPTAPMMTRGSAEDALVGVLVGQGVIVIYVDFFVGIAVVIVFAGTVVAEVTAVATAFRVAYS